jgi:hypothetical protein
VSRCNKLHRYSITAMASSPGWEAEPCNITGGEPAAALAHRAHGSSPSPSCRFGIHLENLG